MTTENDPEGPARDGDDAPAGRRGPTLPPEEHLRVLALREPLLRFIRSRIGSRHRRAIDSEVVADSVMLTYLNRREAGVVPDLGDPAAILRCLFWLADGSLEKCGPDGKPRRMAVGKVAREVRRASRLKRGGGVIIHGDGDGDAPGLAWADRPDPDALAPPDAAAAAELEGLLAYLVDEIRRVVPRDEFDRQVIGLILQGHSRFSIACELGTTSTRIAAASRRIYSQARDHIGRHHPEAFDAFFGS
jgi:hypothetical protein